MLNNEKNMKYPNLLFFLIKFYFLEIQCLLERDLILSIALKHFFKEFL